MTIFLRPIEESDGSSIIKWRNDPNVLSHCMHKEQITKESHKDFFEANILTGRYKQYIVECLEPCSGAVVYPIATVYLKDMDYENKRCELCIFTSNDCEWQQESQSIAIIQLVSKAFNEFGMHKVYSYVFTKYPQEVDLLINAGFTMESVLKEEALNENGEFEDIVRLCVINNKK